jgi:oligopeptide/dipeptide ABC transporter ATP-binding protein
MNKNNETQPTAVLEIDGLTVGYNPSFGPILAVAEASLGIEAGEILAIVGESGSGKTTLAMSVLGLLTREATVAGSLTVSGSAVEQSNRAHMRALRRDKVAAVLQDASGSLNPVRSIGSQMFEAARGARIHGRHAQQAKIESSLAGVGLSFQDIRRLLAHELSGGMSQRVVIAMALLKDPDLLIADEPTSALDVQSQAAIVELLLKLSRERQTSILLITHDIGLALETSDRVAVMYGGRVVEIGPSARLLDNPRHPYTQALLAATPTLSAGSTRVQSIPGRLDASLLNGTGCPFSNRCPVVQAQCTSEFPQANEVGGQAAWCWALPTGSEPLPSLSGARQ